METTLNEFDMSVMNTTGPVVGHQVNYYELAQEPVSGNFYCSETDFFSYGTVHIFDGTNTEISQFAVSTSPGTVVFDVRPSVGLTEINEGLSVYPNPTNNNFVAQFNSPLKGKMEVIVLDELGRVVNYQTINKSNDIIQINVDLSTMNKGVYFLKIQSDQAQYIKRVLKF